MNPKAVSQKVWVQAVVTVVLGSLIAALAAVTPGMLGFLGPWTPVAVAGLTALGAGLSGYMVTDPIREAGSASLAIHKSIAAAAPKDLPAATLPAPVLNLVIPEPVAVTPAPVPAPAPPVPAAAAAAYDPLA